MKSKCLEFLFFYLFQIESSTLKHDPLDEIKQENDIEMTDETEENVDFAVDVKPRNGWNSGQSFALAAENEEGDVCAFKSFFRFPFITFPFVPLIRSIYPLFTSVLSSLVIIPSKYWDDKSPYSIFKNCLICLYS